MGFDCERGRRALRDGAFSDDPKARAGLERRIAKNCGGNSSKPRTKICCAACKKKAAKRKRKKSSHRAKR